MSGKRTNYQGLQKNRVRYKWIHEKAQSIAKISNQMGKENHTVNVNTATKSNEVTNFIQIIPVAIQSGGKRLKACAFYDRGPTVSFIDQSIQKKLKTQGRHPCSS